MATPGPGSALTGRAPACRRRRPGGKAVLSGPLISGSQSPQLDPVGFVDLDALGDLLAQGLAAGQPGPRRQGHRDLAIGTRLSCRCSDKPPAAKPSEDGYLLIDSSIVVIAT